MRSALTAALSGKLDEKVPAENGVKNDPYSFPCLSGTREQVFEDPNAAFERLSLENARLLAGSAPNAVLLPNGSLAVGHPP